MSYNEFTFPTDSKVIKQKENFAEIEIKPCYPGYGVTLGNSLRRVLLSSIPGGAATSVKIEGVKHEFSGIDGVYENVIDIILNIKKLRFKVNSDEPVTVNLKAKGKKKITAKDIDKNSDAVVINKDQFICELTGAKSTFDLTLVVEKGIGYSPIERREVKKKEIGVIEIDTMFSPIQRVSFDVSNTRIGKRTDYEKLNIEIETDGSIGPYDAFKSAALELSKNYVLLANVKMKEVEEEVDKLEKESAEKRAAEAEALEEDSKLIEAVQNEEKKEQEDFNSYTLKQIGLPAKLVKILEEVDIKTVDDLLKNKKEDLLEITGIGESSIKEIKKALGKYGIILSK